jgi:hypothetical protein
LDAFTAGVDGGDSGVAGLDADQAETDAGWDSGLAEVCRVKVPTERSFKVVFVTSEVFDGNLAGIVGGDAHCNRLAAAAGITGDFKAWLSDEFVSAAMRFAMSTVPYALVDGTEVATGWDDLIDGELLHPIDQTECGDEPPRGSHSGACYFGRTIHPVMTGTSSSGTGGIGGNCGNWTISGEEPAQVVLGDADVTNAEWTHACGRAGPGMCDLTAALYCFEQ